MDFITIESHFGVPNNCIRANTRNKCSEDFVEIINQISKIVYPNDGFEIFLMPPKEGSYTDIIKIVRNTKKEFLKNPITKTTTAIGALVALGGLSVAVLTYKDSHSEHLHNEKTWEIEDAAKCLALKEQLVILGESYKIEGITDEQLEEICGDINLKKLKNNRYKILEGDETVASDTTILKNAAEETVISKKIDRSEFPSHIEKLPEEEGTIENNQGVIELISLVVKQQKEGKGIPWKGTYYGDSVIKNGAVILENEEMVSFFMQDGVFKEKIKNKEVTFGSGDNITAKFNLAFNRNLDGTWNKAIYVVEVRDFNGVIVDHPEKFKKPDKNIPPENQQNLFI